MITNIEEAIKLVKKYRSITKEDLDEELCKIAIDDDSYEALTNITGFGSRFSCPLCKAAENRCEDCIHSLCGIVNPKRLPCTRHKTYDFIEHADTAKELFDAINKRADYLEKLINDANRGTVLQTDSNQ